MWRSPMNVLFGLTLSTLVYISHSVDYECDHELWDEVGEGRGIKKLEFSCTSGHIEWHGPYGGLFINIKGPAREHQLCVQASSYHMTAIVSVFDDSSAPKRLAVIKEAPKNGQQKHTMCFPAHGDSLLFIEPDIGSFVSSKLIIDYDVETNPKYGEDACRPCTDQELLYHYCSSDFVAIGQMLDIQSTPSANIISTSLSLIKQQSIKYFTKKSKSGTRYTGQLYTPSQCKMQYGDEKFVFMGKIKFNKAELRCAPTYDDFQELQRTSKLKGTTLCT